MRKTIALVAGLAILGFANWTVWQRERQLAEGRVVLLELAPVDPRSLMQGDYMALNFRIANDAFSRDRERNAEDGEIIVRLDARGVATYVRHDGGEPLAADEARLRYRVRDGRVKFATNAFFFQEGRAADYAKARYGEFRAAPDGELLLTQLRSETLEPLGPSAQR